MLQKLNIRVGPFLLGNFGAKLWTTDWCRKSCVRSSWSTWRACSSSWASSMESIWCVGAAWLTRSLKTDSWGQRGPRNQNVLLLSTSWMYLILLTHAQKYTGVSVISRSTYYLWAYLPLSILLLACSNWILVGLFTSYLPTSIPLVPGAFKWVSGWLVGYYSYPHSCIPTSILLDPGVAK